MQEKHIITIDQSTSGTKVLVSDHQGKVVTTKSKNHQQIYPNEGWVEHDPIEIYENVKQLIQEVGKTEKFNFSVLSITNQRETVVLWDKNTGLPIYNAIVWQCRRTTEICERLKNQGLESIVQEKTGLKIDPYFSATKMKWIFDHVDGAAEKALSGDLLAGTIDSWLIWKLTNGKVHATDYSNASRTLLFNIYTFEWDKELLEIFEIPSKILPVVKSSNDIYGFIEDDSLPAIMKDLPISGVIGDSQGALFGQHCFEPGMAKATYGTGTSVLVYTGETVDVGHGLVSSLAWGIDGEVDYAVEGIINTSGDSVKWLIEDLQLIRDPSEAEDLAAQLSHNEGVYFVPAFIGLGAPYWSPSTRAAFIGINRNSNKSHILRATLESIAYQVKDIIDLLDQEYEINIKELRVDGGATNNQFLMQFQSDMINKQVTVSEVAELSALGSAYLAGLGVGLWSSLEEIKKLYREEKVFLPTISNELRNKYYDGWKEAVRSVLK